jgi:hypothetical protein
MGDPGKSRDRKILRIKAAGGKGGLAFSFGGCRVTGKNNADGVRGQQSASPGRRTETAESSYKFLPNSEIWLSLSEIMRQPWPPQFKNGFWDLFARGKSRKVSVLGAESSHQPQDSMTLPEKTNFSQIFGIPAPFEQILPE